MSRRIRRHRPRRGARGASILAASTVVALGFAACGSSSQASSGAGSGSATPSGPAYEVTTGSVGGLGTVLVNGKGYTLYLFDPDHRSSQSTCSGPCAVAWPPVLLPKGVTAPVAGRGVTATLLGVTTRADGTVQVTYNGWPLYRWVNDTAPGQATGQGLYNLGGRWYAVTPGGNAAH